MHWMPWLLVLALLKAGKSIAARMAIIAMTTRSSIRVKARGFLSSTCGVVLIFMRTLAIRVTGIQWCTRDHYQKNGVLLPVRTFDSLLFLGRRNEFETEEDRA